MPGVKPSTVNETAQTRWSSPKLASPAKPLVVIRNAPPLVVRQHGRDQRVAHFPVAHQMGEGVDAGGDEFDRVVMSPVQSRRPVVFPPSSTPRLSRRPYASGVNAAAKNDCVEGAHSCAGQATQARDPKSFVLLP